MDGYKQGRSCLGEKKHSIQYLNFMPYVSDVFMESIGKAWMESPGKERLQYRISTIEARYSTLVRMCGGISSLLFDDYSMPATPYEAWRRYFARWDTVTDVSVSDGYTGTGYIVGSGRCPQSS